MSVGGRCYNYMENATALSVVLLLKMVSQLSNLIGWLQVHYYNYAIQFA